uniref:Uncharacterized protein LOC113792768 n=1 Tax=Dermatophagoides pteronyssinus TaxID=6956 RepID=A0A6P6Y2E2_DERPT
QVTNFIELIAFLHKDYKSSGFIFHLGMEKQTYAYGQPVCEWLSLKHRQNYPQKIEILSGKSIRKVAYGFEMVVILTENGQIYIAGNSSQWPRSVDDVEMRLLSKTKHFKDIACGRAHALCLEDNGNLFTIGDNWYQNGKEIADYENLIDTELTDVHTIACGWMHSLAIKFYNSLYGWGMNTSNQIANKYVFINHPFLMMAEGQYSDGYENVSAGLGLTLAITSKKEIRQFGNSSIDFLKSKFKIIEMLTLASAKLTCFLYENYHGRTEFYIFDPQSLLSPLTIVATNFQEIFEKFLTKPITFGWSMNTDGFYSNFYHYSMSESITATFNCPDSDVNDLRFELPNDNDDDTKKGSRYIYVQRSYLRMVSEYFNRMLSNEWNDQKRTVITSFVMNFGMSGSKKLLNVTFELVIRYWNFVFMWCSVTLEIWIVIESSYFR